MKTGLNIGLLKAGPWASRTSDSMGEEIEVERSAESRGAIRFRVRAMNAVHIEPGNSSWGSRVCRNVVNAERRWSINHVQRPTDQYL